MSGPVNLCGWLQDPVSDRGVRFATDDGGWDEWSYERLARTTYATANRLREVGVRPDDLVGIVMSTGPAFITTYFGTLLVGGTPAPIAPPALFADEEEYTARTAGLVEYVSTVATEPRLLELVTRCAERAGLASPPVALELGSAPALRTPPVRGDLALLQFTSGSSGRPRGVRVGYDNLEAMIQTIKDWIRWQPEERGAHWLPLHHDMGLIGGMLTPVAFQRGISIMRPEQFVMNPLRWLECFGREDHTLAVGPNFAFSYAVSKVKPEQIEGFDFSRWRVAIIGAERLDPGVLARFTKLAGPNGFDPTTFLPAYGMAEATLAITGVEPDRLARTIKPDWATMDFGSPVEVLESAEVGDLGVGSGDGWLIGCGTALPAVSVTVRDESGASLPDGHLGELFVEGPIVAHGYLGDLPSVTSFTDGGVATGDAGFVHDGDVYVVGRLGDAIKVRGRTIYAEDLESKLAAIPEVPIGRCVALPAAEGEASIAAIVERPPGPWVEEAARVIETHGGRGVHVRVFSAERGSILRTSSGKPRRRVMWRALLRGELDVVAVYDSHDLSLVEA